MRVEEVVLEVGFGVERLNVEAVLDDGEEEVLLGVVEIVVCL